ncbi:MAG: BamA/TamA family outer membrane protein [Bacteroidaceae bacterium]
MNQKKKKRVAFKLRIAALLFCLSVSITAKPFVENTDSATSQVTKRSLFKKFSDYLAQSNKPKPNKKFDFSFLGGPHFSSDVGLGIGLVASGLYSMDRKDSLLPKSNASFYGDLTTKGFLLAGLRGNVFYKKNRYRLDYRLYIYTFQGNFWGIGYDEGKQDGNESKFRRNEFDFMPRFLFRLTEHSYAGPLLNVKYVKATSLDAIAKRLLADKEKSVLNLGVGFSYIYDTRDNVLDAHKGMYAKVDQLFSPTFLGNKKFNGSTDLSLSGYQKIWKGGVLAGELHSQLTYGTVPWTMLASVGSSNRMRGYYEGRYRDKNILEGQIELRQHIWKRHGAVVWVGAANVFPSFSDARLKKTLSNYGIGYRWCFKEHVNIRLDYGITPNGPGFLFNINEAF